MGELAFCFNCSGTSTKSFEDLSDTSSLLHGDNSKLVLLIDPDKEGFRFIVEDTSSIWPVSVEIACLEESISLLEEEMVIDQLLLRRRVHTLEWVEGTGKISL